MKRNMEDFRKKHRGSTNNYFLVFEVESGDIIGRLLNLTDDGLMLLSEEPVEASKKFECRMILPGMIEGCKEIYFKIESRWCNKNKRANWYETGYKINNKTDTCQKVLEILANEWMDLTKDVNIN